MVGREKRVLDGDGYPDGWWGGNGFRYKPIGEGTEKKIIPTAGMGTETGIGIALTDGDGDGNSNPRPVCIPIYLTPFEFGPFY